MVYRSVSSNRHIETTMKSPGRPRNPSAHVIASPLAAFIDANWEKTGLTNEQGAAHFGFIAPNMISHWRTERSPVSLTHIPKLATLLGADEAALFVMWLKQQRLRDQTVPADLVELMEQRLVSANEAILVNAVRNATRNGDPAFDIKTIAVVAGAVAP
jgi:transcriptional regulator with XRE-family HTH domain